MQLNDHINRFVDNQLEEPIVSPMDPPQAFTPTTLEKISYEQLPVFLKKLIDEHRLFEDFINRFEAALIAFKKKDWVFDDSLSNTFKEFFLFMDDQLIPHHEREEKFLFPLLHKRLMASGEHSPAPHPQTPVDVMEDDHIKTVQTSCLVFNLLGIATRLPDARSRALVFEYAFQQGRDLVERLRLHIYKEDEVVFQLAGRLITAQEFSDLEAEEKASHTHTWTV